MSNRYELTWDATGPVDRTFTADDDAVALAIARGLVRREIKRRHPDGVRWRLWVVIGKGRQRQRVRRVDVTE